MEHEAVHSGGGLSAQLTPESHQHYGVGEQRHEEDNRHHYYLNDCQGVVAGYWRRSGGLSDVAAVGAKSDLGKRAMKECGASAVLVCLYSVYLTILTVVICLALGHVRVFNLFSFSCLGLGPFLSAI